VRRALLVVLPLLVLALAAAGCGSSDSGTSSPDPGGSGTSSPSTSSPPSGSASTSPVKGGVTLTPASCTMPRLAVSDDVVVPLLYGRADTSTIPGVQFILDTAAPGGDTVDLVIVRRAGGCHGRATLTVRPHEPFTVLGITAESSAAVPDQSVPNRATASLTVRRSPA
jgi:hypothetical protein